MLQLAHFVSQPLWSVGCLISACFSALRKGVLSWTQMYSIAFGGFGDYAINTLHGLRRFYSMLCVCVSKSPTSHDIGVVACVSCANLLTWLTQLLSRVQIWRQQGQWQMLRWYTYHNDKYCSVLRKNHLRRIFLAVFIAPILCSFIE